MKILSLIVFVVLFSPAWIFGQENNGLITITSSFSVKETTDSFIEIVTSKGLTVFARIDHADNANKQGFTLRPMELVIFGNPRAGTPLMQDNQISGIDLPLKVLVWEDEKGKVWITYNDPEWIASRHSLSDETASVIKSMQAGLKTMTSAVAVK